MPHELHPVPLLGRCLCGAVRLELDPRPRRLDRLPDSNVSFEERLGWLVGLEDLPCFAAKGTDKILWRTGNAESS